jgi:hypothetical protein
MSLMHITAEQRDYLKIIYDVYGTKSFQWNDIKDRMPRRMFTVCCNNKYILKTGKSDIINHCDSRQRYNVYHVNNWRLDPTFVERC